MIKNETLEREYERYDHKNDDYSSLTADIPAFFRRNYLPQSYSRSFGNEELCLQEFTYSLIFGNFNTDNIDNILELFGLESLPNILFLVHLEGCDYIHSLGPNLQSFPVKLLVCSVITEVLKEHRIPALCFPVSNTDKIMVFLCIDMPAAKVQQNRGHLENIARLIMKTVAERTQETVAIGISNYCSHYSRFTMAYEECKRALDRLFQNGEDAFQFFQEYQGEYPTVNQADLTLYASQIIHAINSLDEEDLKKPVSETIDYLVGLGIPGNRIKLNLINLINALETYYVNMGLECNNLENLSVKNIQRILESNFVSSLNQIFCEFCARIIDILKRSHQSSEAKLKFFLDNCFERMYMNSEFNLFQGAELANYNPCYFGRLFKKIYGVAFNHYLARFRVEKSKKLLVDTLLNVAEISECVGFANTGYYCTVFKSITGVSPKQYRSEMKVYPC